MPFLSRLRKPAPLPDSFRFGVAISDHQSEAFDERFPPDLWDSWERQHAGVVPRGCATDFWHRWEEDVLNAHQLGCRAFRFSIAWARVEPREGEFDQSALDHYRAMVLRLRELGMEPIVTLCHFVWPRHVEDRGGLRSDQFAEWFATYAARVRAALEPHVRYWITFNEPNIVLQGFYKLWFQADYGFPPGDDHGGAPASDEISSTITVIRHLFEAHAAARRALRSERGEHNLVSANVFQLGLPPFVQRLIDWNVKRLKNREDWRKQFQRVVERPAVLSRSNDVIIIPTASDRQEQIARLQASGYEIREFKTRLAALVKHDSDIQRLDDLKRQPIAVVRGLTQERIAALQARLENSRIDVVDTHDEALARLQSDQAAALVAGRAALTGLVQLQPEYRLLDKSVADETYLVAIESGHPGLRQAVEQAIDSLGFTAGLQELSYHYFPATIQQQPAISTEARLRESNRTRLGRIQARDRLIIGVQRVDLPRTTDLTAAAAPQPGTEFDLVRALARSTCGDPTKVEYQQVDLPGPETIFTRIRSKIDEWLRAWTVFSTFVASSWWYLGMRGELPDDLCPNENASQFDFVSFDYYFGVSALTPGQLYRLALSMQRQFHQAALWPGGLYQVLRYYHRLFPDKPIVIAENGFADEPTGQRRGEQIAAHVKSVQHAVTDGVDVRAYCVWSITSNREWGLPQTPASDFGLYYVDMEQDPDLKRQPTPSAKAYRKLIEKLMSDQ
jgi:beta-glucosidase/6-phospho-beta-glucosidase/beta-galactosidase